MRDVPNGIITLDAITSVLRRLNASWLRRICIASANALPVHLHCQCICIASASALPMQMSLGAGSASALPMHFKKHRILQCFLNALAAEKHITCSAGAGRPSCTFCIGSANALAVQLHWQCSTKMQPYPNSVTKRPPDPLSTQSMLQCH